MRAKLITAGIVVLTMSPVILPTEASAQVGSSFPCPQPNGPHAHLICASPVLWRDDLKMVQTYQALWFSLPANGRNALIGEAIAFTAAVTADCGIPAPGSGLSASPSVIPCLDEIYRQQRDVYAGRLTGAAAEEADRVLPQHIARPQNLKTLGFLPRDATIDGDYGPVARATIEAWQRASGFSVTGFLGGKDASLLAAEAGSGAPAPMTEATAPTVAEPASSTGSRAPPGTPTLGNEQTGPRFVDVVPLEKEAGTLVVRVQINGAITLNFIVDSGAADVQIPFDVFSTLVRTGTIVQGDLGGERKYRLADGSTQQEPRFVIRELKVGSQIFRNVPASVGPTLGALLLGQSFLSRFAEWTIDNHYGVLRLEEKSPEPGDHFARCSNGKASNPSQTSKRVQELQALCVSLRQKAEDATIRAAAADEQLAKQRDLSKSAFARVALLNEQVAALSAELASLQAVLDISQKEDKAKGVQIANLGRELNAVLAARGQKLEPYRSEFFGKLRQALAGQAGVRIVGDRFVLQNEVLFPIGSADLTPEGKLRIIEVALSLEDIAREIPPGLHWILQVEGYTDATPIDTPRFPSNWELSTQRAISVVKLLINQGVPADRLVAVGFGATHPLEPADTPAAYAHNRRIEFRLSNY